MEYTPRFSQPFTLDEAVNLDVAVITEGASTSPYGVCPLDLHRMTIRDLKAEEFIGASQRNANHIGSRVRSARRGRS